MTVIPAKKEVRKVDEHLATEQTGEPLNESVKQALKHYFSQLQGEDPKDVYQMVLAEVEGSLLRFLMKYTKNNKSRITSMLGLTRSTVIKKLKSYKILRQD